MNSVAGQNSSSTWNKIENAAVQNQSANFHKLIGVNVRESSWRRVKTEIAICPFVNWSFNVANDRMQIKDFQSKNYCKGSN